jgi:peptide/nickel transport system substrate-binding protein
MYQYDNPNLPTLQPWINVTKPPADRFVAVRNPYFTASTPRAASFPTSTASCCRWPRAS